MLLEKLEIKGFKSFGERVVMRFDQGITGVVGPNGSGKSNVVDAIRWVLGEQSPKSLRSEKMDNIIFNGSKKRKPLQMAEVLLTFRNHKGLLPTEYTEVSIGRRYYRSGDGEYLLNGITCRLKDIHSLFMDTGIGSDSYAIIELKMVDEILNDVNNARRTIFEEAAGVAKFKSRKKETLKKLSGTDEDLARVEDLLFEIEKNMRSLERQAKQAERFLKLKAEYRALSLGLASLTLSELAEQSQAVSQQLASAQDQKTALDSRLAQTSAAHERQQKVLQQADEQLRAVQQQFNTHLSHIRDLENSRKLRDERLQTRLGEKQRLTQQISQDQQAEASVQQGLAQLAGQQADLQQDIRQQTAELASQEARLSEAKAQTGQAREQVTEAQATRQTREKQLFQLRKELEINHVQQDALQQDLEKALAGQQDRNEHLETYTEEANTLEAKLLEAQAAKERIEAEQQRLSEDIARLEPQIQQARQQLADQHRQLDATRHAHDMTKSMLENLEGYPKAIKHLKKLAAWKQTPLLSDILTCAPDYRIAIENFLEPYLNHFVVMDTNLAWEGIRELRQTSNGRAHFLLAGQFEGAASPPPLAEAIPALEVVEYEPPYAPLLAHLLGHVYLVKTWPKDAPTPKGTVILSQDGQLIAGNQSISGGSIGLFEGKKIGRAKNLEKLAQKLQKRQAEAAQTKTSVSELEQELKVLKSRQDTRAATQQQQTISQVEKKLAALEARKEQFLRYLQDQTDREAIARQKLDELAQKAQALAPKIAVLEQELAEDQKTTEKLESQLRQLQQTQSDISAAYNEQNIQLIKLRNQLQGLEKEAEYKTQAIESTKLRITQSQQELNHAIAQIRELEADAENQGQSLIALYDQRDQLKQQLETTEADYFEQKANIQRNEQLLNQLRKEREQAADQVQTLQQQANQAQLQIATTRERIAVEFEVTAEELEQQTPPTAPSADLQEKVQNLKARLEKFGPVNHTAIEAYEEIRQRHEFITAQRQDLYEAKTSLLQTIQEIDAVARAQFLDTFEQAKANFAQVFKTLFTDDDSCDLLLNEPNDPLNCKIDIIAKPKGKRPLSINQLSGGEKTLTATALLFAIYLIKPAPFCIFDEVDAPLDDANIDKFNRIIRDFSNDSQFIIVTHNKRTMAATDVIYGISMSPEDPGVSMVVPVRLDATEAAKPARADTPL